MDDCVYVIYGYDSHGRFEIFGVFTTRESAKEAIDKLYKIKRDYTFFFDFCVLEPNILTSYEI